MSILTEYLDAVELDFNLVTDNHIISVAKKINHRPRKSLEYRTPFEVFMIFIEDEKLSSLIRKYKKIWIGLRKVMTGILN
ncbi:integrase [Staphylococcus schweitzeri]|nr:integrase [Staphylococcus schweitzeri]